MSSKRGAALVSARSAEARTSSVVSRAIASAASCAELGGTSAVRRAWASGSAAISAWRCGAWCGSRPHALALSAPKRARGGVTVAVPCEGPGASGSGEASK